MVLWCCVVLSSARGRAAGCALPVRCFPRFPVLTAGCLASLGAAGDRFEVPLKVAQMSDLVKTMVDPDEIGAWRGAGAVAWAWAWVPGGAA